MKTLYLIRHAKSSWQQPGLRDFDRPLNKRGVNGSNIMGKQLKLKGVNPDLIISSPAKRAMLTANIFADVIGYNSNQIEFNKTIYGAGIDELLTIINEVEEDNNVIMLFGHEPTMSYFTQFLTDNYIQKFSTAGVAKIIFDINDWALINKGAGKLEYFIYPKMFD